MLSLLFLLAALPAQAESVQHGTISFEIPAATSGFAGAGEIDAGGYGSCSWGRPCNPPPGSSCPAVAYGTSNLTEKECFHACASDGVNVEDQSSRNGTCHWTRYADGKKQPGMTAPKRSSCHLHLPRGDGPAEGSAAVPSTLEACEADCERKNAFALMGARCEWRSAEGKLVRIK